MKNMIEPELIKEIVIESKEKTKKALIERDVLLLAGKYLKYKEVLAITGVRRSGKTCLMYQLMNKLISQGIEQDSILYINFEDERLAFLDVNDLSKIYEIFLELNNPQGKIFFFLDEIQNIPLWEKWVNRMYEKNIKFIISGSNATLLSSEFSTTLTGRNIGISVFPFSFKEFLKYKDEKLIEKNIKDMQYNIEQRAKIKRLLKEYMNNGGFPEIILRKTLDLLSQYFNDILFKDIIKRYNIKYKDSIEKLALYLFTNISALASYYKLKKFIEARSINTIKNYVSYFEKAYLLFRIPLFSYSIKQQIYNPFKVYSIDTGLRNMMAFKFSKDYGKIAENLVFLSLKRKGEKIYYWKNKQGLEVDFIIKQKTKPKNAIQVCWNIGDKSTKKRELTSLLSALKVFNLKEGVIITEDYFSEEKIKRKRIKYIPLWVWLLS